MRISTVKIQNFRSLKDVEIKFDQITTFIGPNGSGKSSVLRALEWFFNGTKSSIDEEDLHAGCKSDDRIRVRVTFDSLTALDREQLGDKYAPSGVEEFTAWRTWQDGQEKITGKALAFEAFERVRKAEGATAKKAELKAVHEEYPSAQIPQWTTIAGTESAMSEWERKHPEFLTEAEVSDSHFFGFHGEGKLSGLFDYVFVSADLRAAEESTDGRGTIIGRILEKAVDLSGATTELSDLFDRFGRDQAEINDRHLAPQLEELATRLSKEVGSFTVGRSISLAAAHAEVRAQSPKIAVTVVDSAVETTVNRQGHGFQRALLVAALKLLAEQGVRAEQSTGTICLAIEEPELYQHPTQARAFASVLRALVQNAAGTVQVAYATHSPYFVEPRYFDEIRRVTRLTDSSGCPVTRIKSAPMATVCKRLEDFEVEQAIQSRWHQVCLSNLAEAFFADGVIVVEGSGDKAILEGASGQVNSLAVSGVAVASANGKTKLLVPHAILDELGVNALIIFDNDSGCRARMEGQGKDILDIEAADLSIRDQNRKILRYFGLPEEDFPKGILNGKLVAVDDTLETMLTRDWPEWEKTRRDLIKEGRGVGGKNAATYLLAAQECAARPKGDLESLLELVTAG